MPEKKAESKENRGLHNLGGKDQYRIAFKSKNCIKIQSELGLLPVLAFISIFKNILWFSH